MSTCRSSCQVSWLAYFRSSGLAGASSSAFAAASSSTFFPISDVVIAPATPTAATPAATASGLGILEMICSCIELARILQILRAADCTEKGSFSISFSTSELAIALACSTGKPPSVMDCSNLDISSGKLSVILSNSDLLASKSGEEGGVSSAATVNGT